MSFHFLAPPSCPLCGGDTDCVFYNADRTDIWWMCGPCMNVVTEVRRKGCAECDKERMAYDV